MGDERHVVRRAVEGLGDGRAAPLARCEIQVAKEKRQELIRTHEEAAWDGQEERHVLLPRPPEVDVPEERAQIGLPPEPHLKDGRRLELPMGRAERAADNGLGGEMRGGLVLAECGAQDLEEVLGVDALVVGRLRVALVARCREALAADPHPAAGWQRSRV